MKVAEFCERMILLTYFAGATIRDLECVDALM